MRKLGLWRETNSSKLSGEHLTNPATLVPPLTKDPREPYTWNEQNKLHPHYASKPKNHLHQTTPPH